MNTESSLPCVPSLAGRVRRELQIGLLVGIEIGVDRIVRDHRRQHARVRDEIAGRDQRARHAAVDRRAHFGELEIEPRRFERGGGGADVLGAGAGRGRELIEILLRDHVLRDEPLAAIVVRCGQRRLRARAAQLRRQPVDLGLERTRIDAEQQLAFLDARAFGELHRVDEAVDARPDLDAVDGLQAAGEFLASRAAAWRSRRRR